jgi:hypothetical protein
MDAVKSVLSAPAWAYDVCYYYLAMAAVVVVYSLWALIQLLSVPGAVKRMVPTLSVSVALILSGALAALSAMMNFWICRSALKPAAPAAPAAPTAKEMFAVGCSADTDCHAVMGTPQNPSICSCGARGFCGGCIMRNNMEPQMSFSDEFAPLVASEPEPAPASM